MSKIIKISLFFFVAFWFYACKNECTNCEEYTRNLALYIKANGTAKDSISGIEGNIYNVLTGTRTVFKTGKKDSVYSSDIEIFENIRQSKLELDVFFNDVTKKVQVDLADKIDFTESRIQVISIDITFGLLGLEVHVTDYQPDQEIELESFKN